MPASDSFNGIVVVDGSWKVGKSTLCQDIVESVSGCIVIDEPDHCPFSTKDDRASWYVDTHLKRLRAAQGSALTAPLIVMERGLISTLAYNYGDDLVAYDALICSEEYNSIPHILIVGNEPWPGVVEPFGDAMEMRERKALAIYNKAVIAIAKARLKTFLILNGRYCASIHRSCVVDFVSGFARQ